MQSKTEGEVMLREEAVINNLTFDREWLQRIRAIETARRKTLHTNGVPQHFYLVFKLICTMKNEDMSMENISVKFRDVFGRGINASSLSRTLLYLSDSPNGTLGLLSYVDNPFVPNDTRFKGVRLNANGVKLQSILLNKAVTPAHSHVKTKIGVQA